MMPIKLSFDILNDVIEVGSERYVPGKWTESTLNVFLCSYAINTDGCRKVLEHCQHRHALNVINDGMQLDDVMETMIQQDSSTNKENIHIGRGEFIGILH